MSSLNDLFTKTNKTIGDRERLLKSKKDMEDNCKDNEQLKEYINIIKQIEKLDKKVEESKSTMYDSMLENDIDYLDGTHCAITLKKPYFKTVIDTKKFLEKNQPGSKLYNAYVVQKVIKGNIILTQKSEV